MFVTIVIPPSKAVAPISSILGILSTLPRFSQLKGGTKNKPWFASLVFAPIPWYAKTGFEVFTYIFPLELYSFPSIK